MMDPYDRCIQAGLDDRDFRLLQMVSRGRRDDYIAKQMSCNERRVQGELDGLAGKLGVEGRVGLAQWYSGTPPTSEVASV